MLDPRKWYVLYTKPRSEKKVADRLLSQGVEVYCPLQEEVRQWSDRKKKVKVPIFQSYLFVRIELLKQQDVVLRDPGAVQWVHWLGKPAEVRADEIEQIQQFVEEYEQVEVHHRLSEGDEVSITEGPFRGQTGIVIDTNKKRAMLNIPSADIQLVARISIHKLERINHKG